MSESVTASKPRLRAGQSALFFDGVGFSYPDGTVALDGVTLRVKEGERVAILGPNGAGKSTLLLHTNGVLRPQKGRVVVRDKLVDESTLAETRRAVGLVFQDPDDQLFMTTVYDDVAFGPLNMGLEAPDVNERVHEALHAVGLADVASRPAPHLSFGQRKRVALATVLSMRPPIMVLDEPTSNLDPRARRAMLALLLEVDATILVATHDMSVAWELCRRAVIVDKGRVVADGPAEAIMADGQLLDRHGLEPPPELSRCR